MLKKDEKQITKFRYNLVTILIYICGIVLLCQLFFLQIVNGEEYRETSNNRLTRESNLYASRGYILDRNGNEIAITEMTFSLEMYKTKVDDQTLNQDILNMVQVLEKYGCSYSDDFPVNTETTVSPFFILPALRLFIIPAKEAAEAGSANMPSSIVSIL